MRPKKKILLIDLNEQRQSRLRFVLTTHAYIVKSVATSAEAIEAAHALDPELIIVNWPFEGAATLLEKFRHPFPHIPSMVIAENLSQTPENVIADAVLLKGFCSQVDIDERIKVLCARKRGPRKGAQRKSVMSILNASIEAAYRGVA